MKVSAGDGTETSMEETHRYGGELQSILENNLTELAVVQNQVGGVAVQPVYEAPSRSHDVCCHIHLGQLSHPGLGMRPATRVVVVGGVKGRDQLGGLLGESAHETHGGVMGATQVLKGLKTITLSSSIYTSQYIPFLFLTQVTVILCDSQYTLVFSLYTSGY